MKKHILVMSQYFYPEQFRINDICAEWVKRGYQVTVVTGIPNYPQGQFYEGYGLLKKRKEVYQGVEIIRIPLIPRGKSSIMLALNYLSFVVSGFFWKVFTKIEADYIFIFEVSPMTQALPGVWYAKKHKIPCYLYVQDLWPENVEIVTGIKNQKILGPIGKMVDYIYKNCDKILTTSKSFVTAIHKRNVPLEKLEYWPQYAEGYNTKIENDTVNRNFTITFAGNVGTAQGLDILLEAAKRLRDQALKFVIIGEGRYKEKFMEKVNESKVEHLFDFVPKQPPEMIPDWLGKSDVAFLSLLDNPLFSMTIPAKLQTYMACGCVIVACATGETKQIIETSRSGYCSEPGNVDGLVENILKLMKLESSELKVMGLNARDYSQQHFDKKILMDRIDDYFK